MLKLKLLHLLLLLCIVSILGSSSMIQEAIIRKERKFLYGKLQVYAGWKYKKSTGS